ncbi:threonine/serine exporter family protein [Isoptericola sp. b441]|uniref:Threonine/serine exporter family protein n=1 Tax=Actinotalea lenta TaxID=3064654 RepID=A0ABT9DC21_9CELL|nr:MULTISPECIES: threonine/serine exporter family protein [unclassified Isoptericola]MDO8107859.1 threonine/serine exporter family protein [Isoptericola sp. b441]MDO8120471.1 threonine/serine exporter family protein [Isoptericola sp. b490]
MRWDVRRLAQRAVGGPPTIPVAVRVRAGELDLPTVHGVLELGLRVGEAMLSLGAAAADVTTMIQRVTSAFGLEGAQVDLTFTSITASYDPGSLGVPITVMRVARMRTVDYDRLAKVLDLAADVTTRRVPISEAAAILERAHDDLDVILRAPHPYRPALVTLVLSAMAAAVALLLGGGPWVALVAGATTAVIDRVGRRLARWGLPAFFLQAVGAAIATAVAVLLLVLVPRLPVELSVLPPSLVVASGIVVLLAGLSLVGAAEDALSGFHVTASGRVFEVMLLTLGVVVGIGAVLDVSRRLGVALDVVHDLGGTAPFVLQIASAAVVAGAWAVASFAPPRAALVAAAAGGGAWAAFAVLRFLHVGPAVASAGAALLVGFAAESWGPRLRVPSLVASACGIVPLLPGLAIYRGLFLVVDDSSSLGAGAQALLGAAMIGLGLAAGVTLGELVAAPVRRAAWRRRAGRPG